MTWSIRIKQWLHLKEFLNEWFFPSTEIKFPLNLSEVVELSNFFYDQNRFDQSTIVWKGENNAKYKKSCFLDIDSLSASSLKNISWQNSLKCDGLGAFDLWLPFFLKVPRPGGEPGIFFWFSFIFSLAAP